MPLSTQTAARHLRTLQVATACAALGARRRTISLITGLSVHDVHQLFFADNVDAQRGRPPDSPDWYHRTTLLERADASVFVAIFRRIRTLGFGPADALVTGYTHYRAVSAAPRLSFDRAFDLASHLDALWHVRAPSFSLATCPACASHYLTTLGAALAPGHDCPFCKLVTRYARDPRVQAAYPARDVPDLDALKRRLLGLTSNWFDY